MVYIQLPGGEIVKCHRHRIRPRMEDGKIEVEVIPVDEGTEEEHWPISLSREFIALVIILPLSSVSLDSWIWLSLIRDDSVVFCSVPVVGLG